MIRRTVDIGGEVHYVEFGGRGRPIVLVHGLGGSHANWLSVGPRLTRLGRVVALDLAGHGRTRAIGRTAEVGDNRRLLGRFLTEVAREPAVLVGNSMGGFISLGEAALEPDKVDRLILVDPAVPRAPNAPFDHGVTLFFAGVLLPGVGAIMMRRRAGRGPERMVRDTLALCCVDPSRVDPEVVAAHVALAEERLTYGRVVGRDFLAAVRSLTAQLVRHKRFGETVAAVRAPTLIVQGSEDRLVRLEAVRQLIAARPEWRLEILDGIGHVPQLEAPDRFMAVVEPWLTAAPSAAA